MLLALLHLILKRAAGGIVETILIVEDDKRLGEHLKLNLELRGYKVDLAPTAESAQKLMTSLRYYALA